MKKWEYRLFSWDQLETAGLEGWKVFAVGDGGAPSTAIFYGRRALRKSLSDPSGVFVEDREMTVEEARETGIVIDRYDW